MRLRRESADTASATSPTEVDQSFFERSLHILALSSLTVAQPLLDLLSRHHEFFVVRRFDRVEIVALAVILIFVVPAPFIVIEALLLRAPRSLKKTVHSLLIWSFCVVFALLVMARFENLSAAVTIGLAFVLAGVATAAYSHVEGVRSFIGLLAIALVAVPAVFFLNPQVSRLVVRQTATDLNLPPLKTRAPIVFVVFDEFNLSVLLDANFQINRHRYPNLAALADRSTWFRGAVSPAENTGAAVPAILTGIEPASDLVPSVIDHPKNLFTLFGSSHSLWVDEPMTQLCPPELNRKGTVQPSPWDRFAELAPDLGVVYLHLVLPHEWEERLPTISSGWSGFAGGVAASSPSGSPTTQKGFFKKALQAVRQDRRPGFDAFVRTASDAASSELYYAHLMLPHRPWELLPDGRLYPTGGRRPPCLSRESWCSDSRFVELGLQRLILQTMYVDTVIGRLINGLEESGRFDDTLIVLVADHGIAFTPGEDPRIMSENNAHGVLPVPLIIKAPHQTEGRIFGRRVSTLDVLPTILELLSEEVPWTMDGVSRVDGKGPIAASLRVHTKRRGAVQIDPSLLKKKRGFVNRKLRLFGDGSDPDSIYCFGRHAELCGRSTDGLEVLSGKGWRSKIADADALQNVDLEAAVLPAMVRGAVSPPRGVRSSQNLVVALNGVIVGNTVSEFKGNRWQTFSAVLPPSAFRQGENTVEVFRVSGEPNNLVLRELPHK